jgi:hypothetical protein
VEREHWAQEGSPTRRNDRNLLGLPPNAKSYSFIALAWASHSPRA